MPNLTEEQLRQRSKGIGASELAQALGLSPYKNATPYQLWLKKRGEADAEESTEAQQFGHLMEPVIARLYEAENNVTVLPVTDTFEHPEHPWLMATPDYRVAQDNKVLLECKNRAAWVKSQFGEEGTDQVPMGILAQCLGQLAVMNPLVGVHRVDVGVIFGGNEYMQFAVHYDQAAVDRLVGLAGEFWQCVENGTPPAPKSPADVRRMFPVDVGRVAEATENVALSVERLRVARESIKKLEEMEEFLLLDIQSHMGDASTLVMPDGQIAATWKKAKDSQRLDTERLKAEYHNIYEACLKVQEGSRRFLLK